MWEPGDDGRVFNIDHLISPEFLHQQAGKVLT